jgi:hypothetical protein
VKVTSADIYCDIVTLRRLALQVLSEMIWCVPTPPAQRGVTTLRDARDCTSRIYSDGKRVLTCDGLIVPLASYDHGSCKCDLILFLRLLFMQDLSPLG